MAEASIPTPSEIEIAGLLARGLLNKQIAGRRGICEATVKAHLGAFARKAGLVRASRVAVAMAYLRLCDEAEREEIIAGVGVRGWARRVGKVVAV